MKTNTPLETLRYHVTGAIERGEGKAILEMKNTMKQTPIIQSKDISSQNYIGVAETSQGEVYFVRIETKDTSYLLSGGAANAGFIPDYAMEIEFSTQETLQEMLADIEEVEREGNPSGALLAWHGSLCI